MKNISILVILLFLQNFLLEAQFNNVKNYGKVTYERIFNFDNNPISTSFNLIFNPDFSVFYEIQIEPAEDDPVISSSYDENGFSMEIKLSGSKQIFLTDFEKDSIQSQKSVFRDGKQRTYIVKEKIKKIKWSIVNEFKTIGGFEAQKAMGVFRGRNYEAWFTKAIPIQYGPWKLNGLPGLILNVSDDRKEVMFYAKTITVPFVLNSTAKMDFQFNADAERISLQEYVKFKEQEPDEVMKRIISRLPRGAIFTRGEITSNPIEQFE